MLMHHIGIIVRDMEKSVAIYEKMGYVKQCDVVDKYQKCRIVFMDSGATPKIELIEPLCEEASVYNFGIGYHHICYEAEQGEDIVESFRKMKIGKIFTKPVSAVAIGNRKIVFACLRDGTIIEFLI